MCDNYTLDLTQDRLSIKPCLKLFLTRYLLDSAEKTAT